ncbi:MAG: enoyl-CoA hydratase [Sphingomonadales bacterium]|nr:enoyl-CoA hydratase [Sphingomonadales bacterium]
MIDEISVQSADGVCEIRFNRPAKRNAITALMYDAMQDALVSADNDPEIRALVFTAEGETFTAGNDLADFVQPRNDGDDAPVYKFLRALATASKPIVAGVRGNVVGIGMTMLLHCDIVLAAPDAVLRAPFVDLGIVPEAASSLLLPRVIGHVRASAMLMLSEAVDARTAQQIGLVNRLVESENLDTEARAVAATLAAKAPVALRLTKALLRGDPTERLSRIAEEGRHLENQLASREAKESLSAFFEKRPANYNF